MKVVTLGEIMLRLAPEGFLRFTQADKLTATYGGGEANVAVSLAAFGVEAKFITKLPQNEIGDSALNSLRRYGVDTSDIVRGGDRLGIYFLEKGASQRPSKVIYDRENSSIAKAKVDEFDFDAIFKNVDWFHFTGITPAISDSAAEITLAALKAAKKHSVKVSCDLNYRKKLWTREKAKQIMTSLMPFVDVLISNEEDAHDVFGISSKGTDAENGKISKDGYVEVAKTLKETFGFEKVFITLRESISASDNKWSAMVFNGLDSFFSKTYDVRIVDRVGGGDSFAAGVIYSLLSDYDDKKAVEFAVASSCLKHSIEGDYNLTSKEEVLKLMNSSGSGRVER